MWKDEVLAEAVVGDDHPRLSTPFDQGCEFPGNPSA